MSEAWYECERCDIEYEEGDWPSCYDPYCGPKREIEGPSEKCKHCNGSGKATGGDNNE